MDKWHLEESPYLVIYTKEETFYPFYPPHPLMFRSEKTPLPVFSSKRPRILKPSPLISEEISPLYPTSPSLFPLLFIPDRSQGEGSAHSSAPVAARGLGRRGRTYTEGKRKGVGSGVILGCGANSRSEF